MSLEQDTPVQTSNGFLVLPEAADDWDVEFRTELAEPLRVLRLPSGIFPACGGTSTHRAHAHRARPAGTANWLRVKRAPAQLDAADAQSLTAPPVPEPPLTTFEVPGTWFACGETPHLLVSPPDATAYELWIRRSDRTERVSLAVFDRNKLPLKDLGSGTYRVRARYLVDSARPGAWSAWSRPVSVCFVEDAVDDELAGEHERAHRFQLIADTDAAGVTTVTDSTGWPPACPRDNSVAWFRTAAYEGSPWILNEAPDYYRDPLNYYLSALAVLVDRGARFLTWHDLLDGAESGELDVLVQFDVDGASHSMRRLYEALAGLGIRATLMVHRESCSWYAYDVDDDLEWLRAAQLSGWTIGYHNNSIGNVQGEDRAGDYGDAVLAEAGEHFAVDLRHLGAQLAPIRTYTHHGGNAVNRMTPIPRTGLAVQSVDKADAPELWSTIDGAFSDGGFLARPGSLRGHCESLTSGRWFFRNHPVKCRRRLNTHPPWPVEISPTLRG